MIIYSYGKYLFCFILSNYIFIQKFFDFFWLQQIDFSIFCHYKICSNSSSMISACRFQHTHHIYILSIWTCNQFSYLILCLTTKGASELFIFSYIFPATFYISFKKVLYNKNKVNSCDDSQAPCLILQFILYLMLRNYTVNQSICLCFFCCHIVITLCISSTSLYGCPVFAAKISFNFSLSLRYVLLQSESQLPVPCTT